MEEPDKTARKFVLNQVMNRKQDKTETKISEPKPMKLKPVRQLTQPKAKNEVKPIQRKLQPKKLIQKNEVKTKEAKDNDTKKIKEGLVESAETQKKLLDKARDELKKKKGTETVDSFQLPNPINEIETNLTGEIAVSGEIYLPPKFLLNRHYMASYVKYDNVGSRRRTTAAIDSYIKRKKI